MMEVQQYMLDKIGDFKAKVCNPEAHLNNMASCDKEFKRMWKRDKESIDYAGITNIICMKVFIKHLQHYLKWHRIWITLTVSLKK